MRSTNGQRIPCLLALSGAVIAGCAQGAGTPAAPSVVIDGSVAGASAPGLRNGPASEADASRGVAPDLRGEWAFDERIWVLQPSALNVIIGAPAVSRPLTQVVCRAEGTLSIEQDGPTFRGTAAQSVVCSVDGVEFTPPAFAFNPVFVLRNGHITGTAIRFDTGHVIGEGEVVPEQSQDCSNRGRISLRGGIVNAIDAIGSCPVPFSPGEHHSSWSIRRR